MEIVNYVLNSAAVAKMSDIYMKLDIDGVDDVAGAAEVHSAKMIVVKHRTAINKLRLSTNKNAQDFIKTNNKNAAVLIDLLAPIETHLKNEEDKITKEKERIQAEKEAAEKALVQKRVDALLDLNVVLPFFDVAMLTDDEYTTKYDLAKKEFDAAIAKAEEERIEKEAEEKRLADERAEIERVKKEQEAKAKAIKKKEKALEDEKKAIEDEKKKEQERKDRKEFEKKVAEDAIKTARFESLQAIGFTYPFDDLGTMPDAHYAKMFEEHQKAWDKKQNEILLEKLKKERAEKEKKKKAKEETEATELKRQEALRPDKEKLMTFANSILEIRLPELKDEGIQQIADKTLDEIYFAAENLIKEITEE